MRNLRSASVAGFVSACVLLASACGDRSAQTDAGAGSTDLAACAADAVEVEGKRSLALIVGVGSYIEDRIPDLAGPPNDARRIYDLLTDPLGFAFPKANVCLLLDEQATTAAFKQAFAQGLVARAREQDSAVIFFAGHGSQAKDLNGDEPDEADETLMLHDARTAGQSDLLDDELNGMLAALHAKTRNVTLILDSCNSGTATRGDSGLVPRFFEPAPPSQTATSAEGDGDGGIGGGEALPGLVALTAASDGTPALERDGRGLFTDAIITALSGTSRATTYAQLARQVPRLIASQTYQIPYFQGDLTREVFGSSSKRPLGWDVVATGDSVELSGPPLPGFGVGAELRVLGGGADVDPSAAKAMLVVTEFTGVNARARIATRRAKAPPIEPGDVAVLVRPSDEAVRLVLSLRRQGAGAIPAARADALRRAIESDDEVGKLVRIASGGGSFELALATDGALVLRGPENRVRNVITSDEQIPRALGLHARQIALLKLRPEPGADFVEGETLRARAVPAKVQGKCAKAEWVQAEPNEEQVIPLCRRWNVEVALSDEAPVPLLVGALLLSTDGSMFGLPADGRTVRLRPGEKVVFESAAETFAAAPPLDTQDQILVFGTQEKNPVPWGRLAAGAARRGVGERKSTLYRALDQYLQPGTRGIVTVDEEPEDSTWTMSTLRVRVEANPRFFEPKTAAATVSSREYTLPVFDVRPYLPDDTSTSLYRVLRTADSLTRAAAKDGYGYEQHDWSRGTDGENLRLGIDCSRAIWFAFTRSDLPYGKGDRYLSTADMVAPDSPLAEQFERCDDEAELRLGDVLVYRGSRNDGHVVMVIDPEKRVAWGSHGWDGESKDSRYAVPADVGVEYQRIKYKKDWRRWDRQDMQLEACWRYRAFTADASSGSGETGVAALTASCDERACSRDPR